jgi:Ca2+-binding EF-hand superfamily protein
VQGLYHSPPNFCDIAGYVVGCRWLGERMRFPMRTWAWLVCVAGTFLLAACAADPPKPHRWSPNGPPRSENWHSPVETLMKFDADKDGILTRRELIKGLRAEFDGYDTQHTGCLTPDQVRAINASRIQTDESTASPLIDWTQSGCVDFDEYSATMRSLFDQIDRDGDGRLTQDELKPVQRHRKNTDQPAGPYGN